MNSALFTLCLFLLDGEFLKGKLLILFILDLFIKHIASLPNEKS